MTDKRLEELFLLYQKPCIVFLTTKYGCDVDIADNHFMEALLILRRQSLQGKFEDINPKGFLMKTMQRTYLRSVNKNKLKTGFDQDVLEWIMTETLLGGNGATALVDPLITAEEKANYTRKKKAYETAFRQLAERCQDLLDAYYVQGLKLVNIWQELGYPSNDAIKQMKRTCLKRLKKSLENYYRN